jgi:hypothetical protein
VHNIDTSDGPMLKIDTPDGTLLAPGKVSTDQEGGQIVEFSTCVPGQTSRYKRSQTDVLNRTVWQKIYNKDAVLAEIERSAEDETDAALNLAGDPNLRSTEKHERRLQRVLGRAQEFLQVRVAKERTALSLEKEVSYRVTPGCVAAYLGPYLASLDEAGESLGRGCRALDAAASTAKSALAEELDKQAKECIGELQKTVADLRQLGRDAGIRLFKRQPPTAKGLEFLIEQQVPIKVDITENRRKLGAPPIKAGEKTTGALLKQAREAPRATDYLTACRLTIVGDAQPVCCAHFHYDNQTAEATDYRAAHLKTLAQERDTNRPGPLADLPAGQRASVHYAKLGRKNSAWIFKQAGEQTQTKL